MIYRNPDPDVLAEIAALLEEEGFSVSKIVIPENVWTDGNPYFDTNASGNDILRARRAVGAGSGSRRTATKRKKSSRSKPKRAGAKKRRTVTRLRRVRVGTGRRKGYGVMRSGVAPRTYDKGGNEKFTASAFGHRGNALGKWTSPSIAGAMSQADESAPAGAEVTVRGEFTSDGSHWGLGKGRVVAVREGKRWQRY